MADGERSTMAALRHMAALMTANFIVQKPNNSIYRNERWMQQQMSQKKSGNARLAILHFLPYPRFLLAALARIVLFLFLYFKQSSGIEIFARAIIKWRQTAQNENTHIRQ